MGLLNHLVKVCMWDASSLYSMQQGSVCSLLEVPVLPQLWQKLADVKYMSSVLLTTNACKPPHHAERGPLVAP